jgi:predicted SAM-dependent methyltransferase
MPSIKQAILRVCPESLIKPALKVVRKGRIFRYRIDLVLHRKEKSVFYPCCGLRCRSFNGDNYLENPSRFNPERYKHTRQDVLCPMCRALPRHRILALWCDEHIEKLKSSKILYSAPEYSMIQWMDRNGVSYITADLYAEADLRLDIQETGLPDESYDAIIANHVLEHVDDFRKALREMRRILREDGVFICSFPMDQNVELLEEAEPLSESERIKRFGQNDHKRVFGMEADKLLSEAAFVVLVIDGADYPEEILPVIGPADYDINRLFCCIKKGN